MGHLHLNINQASFCPQKLESYIGNLTSYYTDKSNEPTMVSASVIMFVLTGLFFILNLFSSFSDVSAILNPKVRLFLSSALSLFLPVMSYLFSEAKNAGYSTASARTADLSLMAGLILAWMLLVELLRKKVDEIRMRGYSSTIQRAGRVAWLGSLVFFNIKSAGRKAVFSILWILCATKVVQRIAFTEVGKRSYAHGKNASVLTSYMAQMLEHGEHRQERRLGSANDVLKRCKYIVMGEKELVKEATADGYELNEITPDDSIITVGKVWELAETDQRLKRLCLSFALFKLLRRRFEHLPAMTDEEAHDCRNLILNGLYNNNGQTKEAEAVFQVMNDEVNFLSEYYHSVIPVVFASPFFLLTNYFLLPIVVTVLCFMSIILCGNGDVSYAFGSLSADNYTLRSGVAKIAICLLARAAQSPPAFFSIVDLSTTVFLFIIFFYEEIWEFLVFLLSNWFMVSLLCNYTAKPHWRESPTVSGAFRRLLCIRNKMSHASLNLKQFSVLNLRWPLNLPLFGILSLAVEAKTVPDSVKESIMECLVEHDRHSTPLTNGRSVLDKHHLSQQLSWACMGDSVAEVILTWHIATSILEVKRPPQSKEEAWGRTATRLSKYCAYLMAFHPELLPDNQEKAERVFEDMKKELKRVIGCQAYYFSSQRARVEKIMQSAPGVNENTTETATGQGDQSRVVLNGAKLGRSLMAEANKWKVLADVWTELIIFVAPSNEEDRVKGHEDVLVQGGEFVTVVWALTTHIGVSRPPPTKASRTTGAQPEA
ncbi:uncharacterized protein LOC133926133 [Phragmites australis]|uniref:uncharacterized protein LOC133926133 n=1 Tax=Phragmites australis TaxID=29695 RepID=UPI002D767CC6|nr:uncharacterized protein LOC133926133 [Phragmites australis]